MGEYIAYVCAAVASFSFGGQVEFRDTKGWVQSGRFTGKFCIWVASGETRLIAFALGALKINVQFRDCVRAYRTTLSSEKIAYRVG